MFIKTHFLKTLILFFSVNCLNASVSIDSTRNQITKHLVNRIIYEKKQVEKKLKLIKSTAEAEKLYLDFEDPSMLLLNKIEENEPFLIYKNNYNIDYKNLPDSISSVVKLLKKENIEVRQLEDGNSYLQFESNYQLNIFENYIAPDFKAFLEIESNDNKSHYKNGYFETSSQLISERIIARENYLEKFKNNNWQREEVKRSMRIYFSDYVLGDEYTETTTGNKFTPILIKEHLRFMKKYPKSKSIKFLKQIILEFKKNKNRDSLSAYFDKESYVFMNQFN